MNSYDSVGVDRRGDVLHLRLKRNGKVESGTYVSDERKSSRRRGGSGERRK